jgi:hypothetical protein
VLIVPIGTGLREKQKKEEFCCIIPHSGHFHYFNTLAFESQKIEFGTLDFLFFTRTFF